MKQVDILLRAVWGRMYHNIADQVKSIEEHYGVGLKCSLVALLILQSIKLREAGQMCDLCLHCLQ